MASASLQRVGFGPTARGLLVVLLAVAAVGCKSGSSWTAKPSWWTFGGSGEDPAKLAAAPPATTDATKPSATAKPYPTTTTPEGYVMENAQRAAQTQVAASTSQAPTTPASEPTAVTYGSKPPAAATPSPPSQMAAAGAGAGNLSGIAPQVGPYARHRSNKRFRHRFLKVRWPVHPPRLPASAWPMPAVPRVGRPRLPQRRRRLATAATPPTRAAGSRGHQLRP